jgi:periplasmic protein TonB
MRRASTLQLLVIGSAAALTAAGGWAVRSGMHAGRLGPVEAVSVHPPDPNAVAPTAEDEGGRGPARAGRHGAHDANTRPPAVPRGELPPRPPSPALLRPKNSVSALRGHSSGASTPPTRPRAVAPRAVEPPPETGAHVAPRSSDPKASSSASSSGGKARGGVTGGLENGRGGADTASPFTGTPGDMPTPPQSQGGPHERPDAPAPHPRITPPRVIATAGMDYPGSGFHLTVRRQDLGSTLVVEGTEGTVSLRALVAADGTVSSVDVAASSGSAVLDRAAAEAVRSWQFAPATRDGAAIEAYVVLRIRYVVR